MAVQFEDTFCDQAFGSMPDLADLLLKVGGQIGLESWSNYRNDFRPKSTFRNTFSVSAPALD